jgi:hypothetical protein
MVANSAERVIRGGSWNNPAQNCRSAYRNRNDPDNRNDNIGFRCARAHDCASRRGPEQTVARLSRKRLQNQMPPGALVARADAEANSVPSGCRHRRRRRANLRRWGVPFLAAVNRHAPMCRISASARPNDGVLRSGLVRSFALLEILQ